MMVKLTTSPSSGGLIVQRERQQDHSTPNGQEKDADRVKLSPGFFPKVDRLPFCPLFAYCRYRTPPAAVQRLMRLAIEG